MDPRYQRKPWSDGNPHHLGPFRSSETGVMDMDAESEFQYCAINLLGRTLFTEFDFEYRPCSADVLGDIEAIGINSLDSSLNTVCPSMSPIFLIQF